MTAETNGNTWDRQTICTLINDQIIAGSTWTKIAGMLKDKDVHIRRGLHGSQKKAWTAWATYAYYKGGPEATKLPKEDWPEAPKEYKKKATKKVVKTEVKKKEKMPQVRKARVKQRAKQRVKKRVAKRKHSARLRLDDEGGPRLRNIPPARLSIDITDEGARIQFAYRGKVTDELQEVCGELLAIFNRLNEDD